MAQSILTNTAYASGGRIIGALLAIVITGLLTRFFGSEHYGEYSLLLAYGALLQLAADLGLYLTLTREISHRSGDQSALITATISLRLALSLVIFAAGLAVAWLVPTLKPLALPLLIAAVGFLFQGVSSLLIGVYQKHQVVWRAAVGDVVGRIAQMAVLLVVGTRLQGVSPMVMAFTVSAAIALLLHWLFLPVTFRLHLEQVGATWKRLLKESWPLGAMLVLNAIYFRIDTVLLAFFRPSAEVGYYGLAYRLLESGLFFPAMFGGLLLPRLAAAWHAQALVECRMLLEQSLRLMLVAAGLCWLILFFFAAPIIELIAGAEFAPAAPLLKVLSLALACMFIGNIFGFSLVAFHQQRLLLKLYAILAIANIILNVLLLPQYGAQAAAWITVLTEVAAVTIAAWQVRKLIQSQIAPSTLLRLGACLAITGGAITALQPHGPFLVILGLAVGLYMSLVLLLNLVRPKHLHSLLSAS